MGRQPAARASARARGRRLDRDAAAGGRRGRRRHGERARRRLPGRARAGLRALRLARGRRDRAERRRAPGRGRRDEAAAVDVRVVTPHGFATLVQGFTYLPSPPPSATLLCQPRVGSYSAAVGGTRLDLEVANFPALAGPGVTIGVFRRAISWCSTPGACAWRSPRAFRRASSPRSCSPRARSSCSGPTSSRGRSLPATSIYEFLPEPGAVDANRDGTVNSAGDEFVEIVNTRGSAVDLTGWTLSDATSVRHTFPNPTSVPAGRRDRGLRQRQPDLFRAASRERPRAGGGDGHAGPQQLRREHRAARPGGRPRLPSLVRRRRRRRGPQPHGRAGRPGDAGPRPERPTCSTTRRTAPWGNDDPRRQLTGVPFP